MCGLPMHRNLLIHGGGSRQVHLPGSWPNRLMLAQSMRVCCLIIQESPNPKTAHTSQCPHREFDVPGVLSCPAGQDDAAKRQ